MNTTILLLFPLLLQAPQDPTRMSLDYRDGESITAEVLSLQDNKATLRVHVLGGHMRVTRDLSEFTPASAFKIEVESVQPNTFDEHFDLAKRAVGYGLVSQAGSQARAALGSVKDTDAEEAKTAEVRAWAANALEGLLKSALDAGDLREAQHYLKLLSTRLADLRSEDQLEELAAAVDGLEQEIKQQKQEARQAKLDAKARDEIVKRLTPIHARVRQGDDLLREAVRKSSKTVQSTKLCERAISAYRSAWQETQKLSERYPDDPGLAREVSAIGGYLQGHGIRAALHAANMLTVQSDYKGAMDWAQRVLAFDPDNKEAKEMVRTIQIAAAAASSDWGWGWRIVDDRPVPPRRRAQ